MCLRNLIGCVILVLVPQSVYSEKAECGSPVYVSREESRTLTINRWSRISHRQKHCPIEFIARDGDLIRLEITYKMNYSTNDEETHAGCENNYLHVGNYKNPVLMASYKICGSLTNEELVSRGNYLWLMHRDSVNRSPVINVTFQSFPRATCNESEFACSPVQCVSKEVTCDGVRDCDNGRDEYCNFEHSGCFRCRSGHCISPKLSRYSDNWGQELWFLCDDYRHCHDGTDERMDICYRMRSRVDALLTCKSPHDESRGHTHRIWNTHRCDGVVDCLNGEDEDPSICNPRTNSYNVDTLAVIIVVLSVSAVVSGSLAIYCIGKYKKRKPRGNFSLLLNKSPQAFIHKKPSLPEIHVVEESSLKRRCSVAESKT